MITAESVQGVTGGHFHTPILCMDLLYEKYGIRLRLSKKWYDSENFLSKLLSYGFSNPFKS